MRLCAAATIIFVACANAFSRPINLLDRSAIAAQTHVRGSLYLLPQQLGEFEPLSETDQMKREVVLLNFLDGSKVPFIEAWALQKQIFADQLERLAAPFPDTQFAEGEQKCSGVDTVILLQHEPVYTLGTASDANFIKAKDGNVSVVRMDRGGEVTYHGPGQLTVYPILDLRGYKQDIHWYIRALEECLIRALSLYGLNAERKEGITGVWIGNCKVGAVGIKCRKWVTMHGIAVNVEESSLANFEGIVPCGLENREVGCLNQFLPERISVSDFANTMQIALQDVFKIRLVHR